MRILILSSEVWNDKINGNNVISNWFEGMNAEFANIYCQPGLPYNKCCKRYFQLTDKMMVSSIYDKKKAGKAFYYNEYNEQRENIEIELENKKFYSFLRSISGSFLRFIREIIWLLGQYDIDSLKKFINDFEPDAIFSERMASCKMLRLEKTVHSLCVAPFFAFTGDDEYSLKQINFSPFFWINRFMIRKKLKENVKFYEIYYSLSLEQAEYYEKKFKCRCEVLQKCGQFDCDFEERKIGNPIKLIYAGKFYCNRWKALVEISKAISSINRDCQKMILHIYTKDKPNIMQNRMLNDGYNSRIIGAIDQENLKDKYKEYDIALHVESRDIKNRLSTRFSYSTKIIDCLFSGCAVLAYCWKKHSGLTSLIRENSAICVSSYKDMKKALEEIALRPNTLLNYQRKAYDGAVNYHNKQKIQKNIIENIHIAKK